MRSENKVGFSPRVLETLNSIEKESEISMTASCGTYKLGVQIVSPTQQCIEGECCFFYSQSAPRPRLSV